MLPLDMRMDGPQSRFVHNGEKKSVPMLGLKTTIVQLTANAANHNDDHTHIKP